MQNLLAKSGFWSKAALFALILVNSLQRSMSVQNFPFRPFFHLYSFQNCRYTFACHQDILKYSTSLESCSVPSLLCRYMKNSFVGSGIDKVIAISASITIQLNYLFGEIAWNRAGVKLRGFIAI